MYNLSAVIERDPESGWYVGYIPSLPGAHSQAAILEELRSNLLVAARLVIEDMLEQGEELHFAEFLQVEQITVNLQP